MQPTADEIRHQLDRMLASDSFVNSDRLSRFLRYVVERTLAGEGDRLKEYVVGTEVFERDERYDPRVDSIVRVEAGRLRAKLEEYYQRAGRGDDVVIRMRRGSYAPTFEKRDVHVAVADRRSRSSVRFALACACLVLVAAGIWAAFRTSSAARGSELRIAVLPFATYSTDENVRLLAARVTDGVTSELARLGTLGVVSHTSALQFAGSQRSMRQIAQAVNADLVVEGTLERQGDDVRLEARLVDARRDRKLWVKRFEGTALDIADFQRRIAAGVADAAASLPR